ncbi:AMP-binding protein [Roseateles koreensis]|uniref:Long-chain-fatty-acid--CoA ligase n=1 Tax=Roseateles koreensis TaxID=2987526 RepID=A0ABT5KLK8_9BURK|nr:AMP-binding protein [Roseateles koreensis]MDC8783794.1 AMP-binding protein [Roseateles koreensis]
MSARHWTESYGNIPTEIDPDRYRSVLDLIDEAITKYADAPAFKAFGKILSYNDVDRLSQAFAAYLQGTLGVKKGDRIALMMPNVLSFPIAMLGILRVGAVQVNVNPLYTARELTHQLNDAGVKVIVLHTSALATLAEIKAATGVASIVSVDLGDAKPRDEASAPANPEIDPRLGAVVSLTDAIAQGTQGSFKKVPLSGSDLIFLQYTGGTTGVSKGAALSHRNLVANIEQYKAFMPEAIVSGAESLVTAIPVYHIFALTMSLAYFSVGALNWLVANPRDMDGFVDTIRQARPTIFVGVNSLYAGLVQHPKISEVDWSRLKLAVGGGAAVVGATSQRWQQITGNFIREGYGLSETSPVVSFNPAYIQAFTGTTGLPMPSTDIKLLDDQDLEVSLGEAGEICVKGPQVMRGYWQQPQANATAFTNDGYFRTGDIGVFDEKGFLKIVDRKKDMIIVSGFNVFPNEIEAVAASCPGVVECACIGVPDEKSGESVQLFVVKTSSSALTEKTVLDHCRSQLTGYKIPRRVRFMESLPKSTVGKILRRELRDLQ